MIANSVKGKILVFAVFFLGIITGALLNNVYETRLSADAPGSSGVRRADQELGQFFDYLNATPEQRQQWLNILQETKPEYDKLFAENRKLMEPTRPKFDALREETRDKIRAILTEEQRVQYDEYNERRRKQRQSSPRPN